MYCSSPGRKRQGGEIQGQFSSPLANQVPRNIVKVRHCLISDRAPGLALLAPLQARGALHLVGGHGLRYHPNIYLFHRGSETRALLGSARLTEEGFGSGIESVVRVDSARDDPFTCALAD